MGLLVYVFIQSLLVWYVIVLAYLFTPFTAKYLHIYHPMFDLQSGPPTMPMARWIPRPQPTLMTILYFNKGRILNFDNHLLPLPPPSLTPSQYRYLPLPLLHKAVLKIIKPILLDDVLQRCFFRCSWVDAWDALMFDFFLWFEYIFEWIIPGHHISPFEYLYHIEIVLYSSDLSAGCRLGCTCRLFFLCCHHVLLVLLDLASATRPPLFFNPPLQQLLHLRYLYLAHISVQQWIFVSRYHGSWSYIGLRPLPLTCLRLNHIFSRKWRIWLLLMRRNRMMNRTQFACLRLYFT